MESWFNSWRCFDILFLEQSSEWAKLWKCVWTAIGQPWTSNLPIKAQTCKFVTILAHFKSSTCRFDTEASNADSTSDRLQHVASRTPLYCHQRIRLFAAEQRRNSCLRLGEGVLREVKPLCGNGYPLPAPNFPIPVPYKHKHRFSLSAELLLHVREVLVRLQMLRTSSFLMNDFLRCALRMPLQQKWSERPFPLLSWWKFSLKYKNFVWRVTTIDEGTQES